MNHPAKTIDEAVRFFLEKQGDAMIGISDMSYDKEELASALMGVMYASAALASSLETPAVKDRIKSALLGIALLEDISL